ncbi:MAG: iron-containing alcohol dehydrogenase [Lachnospiraceae bacterium]|nr:iron-containing alcohol dehydrogenase [Lachnospiraceae bacterium]
MSSYFISNIGTTRFAAGLDCTELLPEELAKKGVRHPLIVTDQIISGLDPFSKLINSMKKSGMAPVIYDQVTANPKDYEVMDGAAIYKENGCDGVIGIGGGSCMDSAKGIAAMVRHEGNIMDYGRSTPNRKTFTNGREPLFAIPATTGTGSELSPHAVITNTANNNRKSDVHDPIFYNDMFFLDPAFAASQPDRTVRDTGIDALSHIIDSYTNRMMLTIDSPLHTAMALEGCRLITTNIRKVIGSDHKDMDAILALQWGAMLGGAMLDLNASAIHGLSGALQKYRHEMTHGISCGVIMAACMNYNLQTAPEKFASLAKAMGEDITGMSTDEAAAASVKAVRKLLQDICFPRFSDYHFTDAELHEMAKISAGNSMLPLNARPIESWQEVLGIYLDARDNG